MTRQGARDHPGPLVHAAVTTAAPELRAADRRVRERLSDAYRTAHTRTSPGDTP